MIPCHHQHQQFALHFSDFHCQTFFLRMSPSFSLLALSLLSALTSATLVPSAPLLPRQANSTTNNTVSTTFKDIVPSTKLNWRECYLKRYQCAYLTVPLDYKNPSVGTTDIAFIRYLVSENVEDLLFNPGIHNYQNRKEQCTK